MSGQPRPQGSSNRSTLRVEYFYDHPALASKHESAYTNSSKDKAKVWCKRCFENLVMGELVLDEQRLRAGEVAVVRTRMEIETDGFVLVWARPKETPSSQRWQAGHMPTMRTHLASCSLQPDEVRAAAAVQHDPSAVGTWLTSMSTSIPSTQFTLSAPYPTISVSSPQFGSNQAQQQCRGKEGTLETDSWSGVNQLHLVPFMVNVNRQLHTVKVYDTTSRVKNAENLLVMIREVINIVENEWGIIVVAITSDCGGDSRAAHKAIVQENTRLVGPDCYAHQINLIVGDYFKVSAWFFIYSEKADQRIWSRTLAVVRAVLTRWTSHFLAYRRLLEIKNPLEILASDPRIFESGDAKSHAKTREMLPILRDSMFWHYLARIKFHIQPFAIAANVTQSAHCRLDEVLLTFAFLLKQFLELADPDDQLIKEAVITSLETRWAKADQDVFVAAVVLNPFVKAGAFAQLHLFHNAGLMALLSRLWTRFYDTSPPEAFQSEVLEYLSGTGKYEDMESYADAIQAKARQNKTSPDPLEVWKGVSFSGAPPTPLGTLANRILSICANSASVERLFSAFGLILTKLRNRLGTQNLTNLAELKMYIQDEHRQKNSKTRLKRHFETTAARSSAAPTTLENTGSTISLNSPVPVVPSSSIHHAPSSISASVPPSSSDVEPVAESDETTASTSSHIPRTRLRAIVAELHDAIDRDDDVNTTQTFPSRIKEKLSNMFNFQQSYWIESHTRSAMRSLEDEMEVYELLDLDAAGEDNFEEDSGDAILGD
ncbi:hypothetical protein GLOTRDRAFT_50634 [Gloeophyllum trabeum ATCC 11539]|uniref:HAT C-terminal dimerisation domain-containing protein n=1 Tax=Gloeophyllum trabeum (strain ATCC 11539 / FP-39264 / Madison 617) TaxID=670483 RepID=S7R7I8_GLOTA|nr:uncharacterized protein GLOTRDRAFT_50634 [Gloeophyllum trabeum ATCC 11539]EPQ50345.1 hypothetical protein GLOTRDRAFT_50634 [Gloeophyllum trabeum ATCC 11539]